MSYLAQTRIAADPVVILRISACAASEGIDDPQFWVQQRMLKFSASEGWADAYLGSAGDDPGSDEDAITDVMIRGSVQRIRAAETPLTDPTESPAE